MGADSESWAGRLRGLLHRMFDARRDPRTAGDGSDAATLTVRARDHQVSIIDISLSGAMIAFDGLAREGDPVALHLPGHGKVAGQIRWVRDGKAGIYFTESLPDLTIGAGD